MLASGVDGDATAVCSDVCALEDAPAMLVRPCFRRQRLGSATMLDATRTNCLKCAGAWITLCGASSESERTRSGTAVLSRLGFGASVESRGHALCEAYLYAGPVACWAHNLVRVRIRRPDVAHGVFVHFVFLGIVFYLREVSHSPGSACGAMYLGVVCPDGAVAVYWGRIDCRGIRARRREVVRCVAGPRRIHQHSPAT